MTTTDKTLFWSSEDDEPSLLYPDSEDGKAEAIYEAIERERADDEGRIPETVTIWAWKPTENKIFDADDDALKHVENIIVSYKEEYSCEEQSDEAFSDCFNSDALKAATKAIAEMLRSLKPTALSPHHSETITIREWAAIGDNGTATFQDDDEQWVMLSELLKKEENKP
jgi:hypothetical protein